MWLVSSPQVWILFQLVSLTLAVTSKLAVDKDGAKDVDECQNLDSPPCSQKCTNTPGSYKCECGDGYSLDVDGSTCKAKVEPQLIYGKRGEIQGLNLRTDKKLDWFPEVKGLRDLASHGEHLFLSENSSPSKIYKNSYMFRPRKEIFKDTFDFGEAENIRYDPYSRILYVLDTKKKLLLACEDPKGCAVVYTEEQLGKNPTNMELHAKKGVVYWSTYDTSSVILSGGMDGRELRPLVNRSIGYVTAMTVDPTSDQIYFYDSHHNTVERIQDTGLGRKMVLVNVKIPNGCLAVSENEIIWADEKDWVIKAANKFTGHGERTLLHKYAAAGIVTLQVRSTETSLDMSCIGKRCSDFCLRGRNQTSSCACPMGYHLAGQWNHTCELPIKGNPVFLASSGDIKVIKPAEPSNKNIAVANVANIGQVVWLPKSGGILFSKRQRDGTSEINLLQNVNLDKGTYGDVVNILQDLGTVESLAVDEDHKLLVFLEVHQSFLSRDSDIVVASLDGKFRKNLQIQVGEVLAFAMECGELYVSTQNSGAILKCEVENQSTWCRTITSVEVGQPIKLVLEGEFLYWADSSKKSINKMDKRGKNRRTLVSTTGAPLSLAVYDSQIFWTEQNSKSLHFKATAIASEMKLGNDIGRNLALVGKSNSSHDDECSRNNGGCSQICWGHNAVCLCNGQSQLEADQKTCINSMDCEGLACKDGTCELHGKFCDGLEDCFDGSDEEDCGDAPKECTKTEFQCKNKECIPISYRCDKSSDCKDDSDEKDCPCPDEKLECKSKLSKTAQCLQESDLCDGVWDCEDGSDELNCQFEPCEDTHYQCRGENSCVLRSEVCDGFEDCKLHKDDEANCRDSCDGFPCNNKTCLPREYKCDGKPDCVDQEDERFCHGFLLCDSKLEFECSNSQCISSYLKCDGTPHCQDGSDEVGCPPRVSAVKCTGFQCDSGQCIDVSSVCDNYDDCSDGMDEEFCNNSCASMSCPQACHIENGRPVCTCNPGYTMFRTRCLDVDECAVRYGNCSHICENTRGGYKCKCPEGFRWSQARQICQANGARSTVYVAIPEGVAHLVNNGNRRDLVVGSFHMPTHFDVNVHTGQIYWTSWTNRGGMELYGTTGAPKQTVVKLMEVSYPIKSLAIDWITDNLFYSMSVTNTNNSIHAMNTVNRYQKTLVNSRKSITQIALHPQRALMFWLSGNEIIQSSMTGHYQTVLYKAEGHPASLAIDFAADRLYWHSGHSIETVNLDGAGFFTLALNLPSINSLDVFEGVVYINDDEGVAKVTAAKPTPERYSSLRTSCIKVNQKMKQPLLKDSQTTSGDAKTDVCESCEYLCVLSKLFKGVYGACMCPDYYTLDSGHNCRAPGYTPSTTVKTTTTTTTTTTNVPTTTMSKCASHPCLNGGSCRNAYEHVYCKCPKGFTGVQCEKIETETTEKMTTVAVQTATEPTPKPESSPASYWWVAIVVLVVLAVATSVCFLRCRRGRTPHTTIKYSVGDDDDYSPEDSSDYTITNPVYRDPQELQNEDVPTWRKILIRSLALTKNPDPVDMTRVDMTDDLFSFQDTSKTNLITN